MSDDLNKKGPPDGIRINVNEAWELSDWSKHFGVTPDQLKEAVRVAGPMTKDVKQQLGK